MPHRTSPRRAGQAIAAGRPVPAMLAAVILALCLLAFPVAVAHAEEGACPPGQAICLAPAKPSDTPTPTPTQEPVKPAPPDPKPTPVLPAPTVAPVAPQPAPTAAPESPALTETATPTPSTPVPAPSAATAPPSTESNWNKPIENSKKATQAAVVVGKDGPGSDMGGLMAIMGGVLLIGLGGLAFALWSRNRLAGH